jgi:hypothetical protein
VYEYAIESDYGPDSLLIITDLFSSTSYWEDKQACDSVCYIRKNLMKSNDKSVKCDS